MLQNVVVGAGHTEDAEAAVRSAVDLVRTSGGTVHIVCGYKPGHHGHQAVPDGLGYLNGSGNETEEHLRALARIADEAAVPVVTHPVTADPVEALTTVAEQQDADLIVVGHHRGTRARHAHRSISHRLKRRTDRPVMIVPLA